MLKESPRFIRPRRESLFVPVVAMFVILVVVFLIILWCLGSGPAIERITNGLMPASDRQLMHRYTGGDDG